MATAGGGVKKWGGTKKNARKLLGGGATIRIGRKILCLPFAGFIMFYSHFGISEYI